MASKVIIVGLSFLLLSPLPSVLAQGAVNTPNAPTQGGGVTKTPGDTSASSSSSNADEVTITAIPVEEDIMPTNRPSNSVYGTDLPVQDTPRNATIISREQLSAVDIQDPRDFSKLSSDSFTQSNFGAPANPSIRGQTADVFVNGIRRGLTSNGNGFPIDFNSVESIDIIKGPANSVYGASQYVGGYVDEITKQPFFDKLQGNIGTTIGQYDVYRWNADAGGPLIKDKLAFRLSYTGEESGSYYDDAHKQTEAVYAALTWTPNARYTLALSGEWNEADYNENNGINRVTQNLIDNDKYITGTVFNPPVPGFPNGLPNNGQIGAFFNPVVAGPTVDINHMEHIIGPNDGSYGHTEYAQAIQTLIVNENFKIVNNTLYERIDRRTYNSQQFDEVLRNNSAVDNRLEFIIDNDLMFGDGSGHDGKDGGKEVASTMSKGGGWTIHNQLNTGIEFRYQNNTNYDTFAVEPFDAFDITKGPSSIFIPIATNLAAGDSHIPGEPARYVFSPLNGDNAHSNLYEFGPYFQDVLKLTEKFSLLFGARADILYVDAKTPPGTPAAEFKTLSTTQALPNANISPTYKPFPWLTTYFTFNFSQSTNTGDGGDYSPTFTSHDFHQPSYLYEVGSKLSLLNNRLFLTATGYVQNRQNPSQGGTSVKIEAKGLEFDAAYQPNKHFYATASYSLLDSHTVDPGFVHEYLPITFSTNVAPGTMLLTDVPPPGFAVPNGHYRTPGYPEHLFNTLATYKTDFGLGFTADLQVTSPMTLSYDGHTKVPWQYNVDFSVFYQYKRYEVRLGLYNVTNQHNWDPANPIYGNESVFADEPFHVEGTFKIKF